MQRSSGGATLLNATAPGAFVISTGRCASTFLSALLRAHPQVLSLSEFFSMLGGSRLLLQGELSGDELWAQLQTPQFDLESALRWGPVPELLAARWLSSEACARLAPPLLITLPHLHPEPERLFEELGQQLRGAPRAPVVTHLRGLFSWLGERFERRVWVERSGGSAEYAPELLGAFPEARAVFLVRDGVDCALSMSRHPLFRQRVTELVQRGAPAGALDASLEVFGSYWSAAMQRAWSAFTRASRAMVLRYEDLIADSPRELARVAAFLELDPAHDLRWRAACVELSTQPRVPSAQVIAAEARARLARTCRPGQRCLARFEEHCT